MIHAFYTSTEQFLEMIVINLKISQKPVGRNVMSTKHICSFFFQVLKEYIEMQMTQYVWGPTRDKAGSWLNYH